MQLPVKWSLSPPPMFLCFYDHYPCQVREREESLVYRPLFTVIVTAMTGLLSELEKSCILKTPAFFVTLQEFSVNCYPVFEIQRDVLEIQDENDLCFLICSFGSISIHWLNRYSLISCGYEWIGQVEGSGMYPHCLMVKMAGEGEIRMRF